MNENSIKSIDWAHKLPDHWAVIRIKYIADTALENSFADGDWIESPYITDAGIRYLTSGNIGDGIFKEQGCGYISEKTFAELNCKYAYPGDLVFSRLNAPFGRACILPDAQDKYVLAVDNVIVRTKQEVDKHFICYVAQCNEFHMKASELAKGTAMRRISRTQLGDMRIPFPPLHEQKDIVLFLNAKCAAIDEAIERHKKIIEKLDMHRRIATFNAVTKGISRSQLVPSGEEWLGDIPCSWKVQRNWTLFRETNERGEDGLPVLTVSINSGISDKQLEDDEQDRTFIRIEDKSKYKRVRPGDIAYNMMRAWQGAFGAARVDGLVSPAYVTIRPIVELDSRYYEYLMRSDIAAKEFEKYSRGITDFRLRLYYPEFKNVKVCVPPLPEQHEIADYLDDLYRKTDAAVERTKKIIEKLEEYRKSIIYQAVTGKIDCRKEGVMT